MTTTKIYRVQATDGRGPWRPGFSHKWIEADASAGRLTETVMDLMPIEQIRALPDDQHYGCGCRSLDVLLSWFTPRERVLLFILGYRIVELQVDAVLAESSSQVFFSRQRPLTEGVTFRRWHACRSPISPRSRAVSRLPLNPNRSKAQREKRAERSVEVVGRRSEMPSGRCTHS